MLYKIYHEAWLQAHPNRTEEWLKERLSDGFHIHHVDGDHNNNAPENLILVDGTDHLRLHGMVLKDGIQTWRQIKHRTKQEAKVPKPRGRPRKNGPKPVIETPEHKDPDRYLTEATGMKRADVVSMLRDHFDLTYSEAVQKTKGWK